MSRTEADGSPRAHWDGVYGAKSAAELSWTQAAPGPELALIRRYAPPGAAILDVGSGRTGLIAALIAEGFADLTALDLSAEALARASAQLGAAAESVAWVCADVTTWRPSRSYDLWHDRAVLHFLTDLDARAAYRQVLLQALRPGGVTVLSTFAPDGPERCSGLPVRRYGMAEMTAFLGPDFATLETARAEHRTPWGAVQPFHLHAAHRR